MPDAARQKQMNVRAVTPNSDGSCTRCAAITGTATSRFFTHWCGRSETSAAVTVDRAGRGGRAGPVSITIGAPDGCSDT